MMAQPAKTKTKNTITIVTDDNIPTDPENTDYHTITLYISEKSNALKKAIMKI